MSDHSPDALLSLFDEVAAAVAEALGGLDDWGLAGTREGQYLCDLAADEAAVGMLLEAGLGVCSEESGVHAPEREVVVVLDPVDGSTNASRGFPWYAISQCAVDAAGALAGYVRNLASGEVYTAARGSGAFRDGSPIRPSEQTELSQALIGVSGYPAMRHRWRQYRSHGASALDLCGVADGRLDGFYDCGDHSPWDYLGAMLVCEEAGAAVCDAQGRNLTVSDHQSKRRIMAGCTQEMLENLLACAASEIGGAECGGMESGSGRREV